LLIPFKEVNRTSLWGKHRPESGVSIDEDGYTDTDLEKEDDVSTNLATSIQWPNVACMISDFVGCG